MNKLFLVLLAIFFFFQGYLFSQFISSESASFQGRVSRDCGQAFYPAPAHYQTIDSLASAQAWGIDILTGPTNVIFIYEHNILTWMLIDQECGGTEEWIAL